MRLDLAWSAFAPLAEDARFMRAHLALGAVVWTNEMDRSPDTLYLCGVPLRPASG